MDDTEHRTDQHISTFVFNDFESTGLLNQRPRITELCLLAVHRQDLLTGGPFPRTVNKLTLCLNPQKLIGLTASQITGLYNDSLELQDPFNEDTVKLISSFLKRLQAPVCLVAHNGNGFDFPLLMAEMNRINESLDHMVLCADSLEAFRVMDGLEPRMTPPQSSSNSATNTPSSNGSPATTAVCNESGATLNSSSNQRGITSAATIQMTVRLPANQNPSNHTSRPVICVDNPDYQTPDKPIQSYLPPVKRKHVGGVDHSHKVLKSDFDVTGASVFPRTGCTSGEKVRKRLRFETPQKSKNITDTGLQTDDKEAELLPLETMFSGSLEDCDLILAADIMEAHVVASQSKETSQNTVNAGMMVNTDMLITTAGTNNYTHKANFTNTESDKPEHNELTEDEQATTSSDCYDDNQTLSYNLHLSESLDQTGVFTPSCSQSSTDTEVGENNKLEVKSELKTNTETSSATGNGNTERLSVIGVTNTAGFSATRMTNTESSDANSETKNPNDACYVMAGSGYSVNGADISGQRNGVLDKQTDPELRNQLLISQQNNTTPQKQMIPLTAGDYKTPDSVRHAPTMGMPAKRMADTPDSTGSISKATSLIQNEPSSVATPTTPNTSTQRHITPKKKSYKLGEIYARLYGHLPEDAHRAEDDCVTMVKCVRRSKGFLEWVDQNAVPLSTIEPAYK